MKLKFYNRMAIREFHKVLVNKDGLVVIKNMYLLSSINQNFKII